MIISKKYAQKLVRKGKATIDGRTTTATTWEDSSGSTNYGFAIYRVVNRLDIQRVDHYKE